MHCLTTPTNCHELLPGPEKEHRLVKTTKTNKAHNFKEKKNSTKRVRLPTQAINFKQAILPRFLVCLGSCVTSVCLSHKKLSVRKVELTFPVIFVCMQHPTEGKFKDCTVLCWDVGDVIQQYRRDKVNRQTRLCLVFGGQTHMSCPADLHSAMKYFKV